jgi:hypothetical protein
MSCEREQALNQNPRLEDEQQFVDRILDAIATDDELKTLTEEDIKAIYGGLGGAQEYGSVRLLE